MRLCLLSNEFFAWGKYGGYGTATRLLASELTKRGLDITVVTPQRGDQGPVENVDGVQVFSYPATNFLAQMETYQICNADIYHALEPTSIAYFARRAMPDRKHIVTFRYVRSLTDLLHEVRTYLQERRIRPIASLLYERNPLVTRSVRAADATTAASEFEGWLARRLYRLEQPPVFAPTPTMSPLWPPRKAKEPTVCFVGRFEKRKNPEGFFELARRFPEVRFIALGAAQSGKRDAALRRRYGSLPNLEMPGFLNQFSSAAFEEALSQSWILINTSKLEGMPSAFLQAALRECAILSRVDPDGFASRFGYCTKDGDFDRGLRFLLANDEWRKRGQLARDHVSAHYGNEIGVKRHLELYEQVLMKS